MSNRVPYLVQVYLTGESPNYELAMKNGGFDTDSKTFPAQVGEVLDIVWASNSGPTGGFDFHPMHIHGDHAWDLGSGDGTYNAEENEKRFEKATPLRRDTTILYRYRKSGAPHQTAGWRAWRIRVTEDNVGAWMMHCHIAQHAVMGMNTIWMFGDAAALRKKFPAAPYLEGYLNFGGSAYGGHDRNPQVYHFLPEDDELDKQS
ncbi:Multicopper oxidase aurL2 [Conoideocrella luteorostrata]|uniref:Multicopper oxidase aurL2 n=1 Tax=Conoideocrella luteorostrata TaxID=1105319 RepID=A0AAJ0G2Q1_9HYPO|nr:Multicopper oxidase aurL2 [Conoideocrella luteorostrata]